VAAQLSIKRKEYSSKANFISQLVESTDAEFRVTNIDILGKAKAAKVVSNKQCHGKGASSLPLASTRGSIDYSLGSFDFSKSGSVYSKSLIISVRMKSADVNVAIAGNGIGQALIKSSHALSRSEDSWNSRRNSRVLYEQCIDVNVNWDGLVRQLGRLSDVCR
jgi:hypothetical protein